MRSKVHITLLSLLQNVESKKLCYYSTRQIFLYMHHLVICYLFCVSEQMYEVLVSLRKAPRSSQPSCVYS